MKHLRLLFVFLICWSSFALSAEPFNFDTNVLKESLTETSFKEIPEKGDSAGVYSSARLGGKTGMWAATQFYEWKDYNMLTILWWEHKDSAVRAYVASLLIQIRGDNFEGFVKNLTNHADRFVKEEREMRKREIQWAVENRGEITKILAAHKEGFR